MRYERVKWGMILGLCAMMMAPAISASAKNNRRQELNVGLVSLDLKNRQIVVKNKKGEEITAKVTPNLVVTGQAQASMDEIDEGEKISAIGSVMEDKGRVEAQRVVIVSPGLKDDVQDKRVTGSAAKEDDKLFIRVKGREFFVDLKNKKQIWRVTNFAPFALEKGDVINANGHEKDGEFIVSHIWWKNVRPGAQEVE